MNAIPETMQAWAIRGYGGPETMRFERLAVPQPRAGELLVRVEAASVNPIDWKMREGLLRAVFTPVFPRVLGRDCCGTVVAAGEGCAGFAPGDRVLAVSDPARDGTHAEFAAVPCAQAARVPAQMPAEQAACLGVAGLSAYIPIVEVAAVRAGQRVLVHAGAGGVGGLAIQIARHLDAEVLATCGGANLEYCKSLGAQRAIDYARERFESVARECDAVLDTLGGEVHRRSFEVLKPGGLLVYLAATPVDPHPPRADVRVVRADIRATTARLAKLLEWAAAGVVRAQVGASLPLARAPEAYALSATGHARGKIVLTD